MRRPQDQSDSACEASSYCCLCLETTPVAGPAADGFAVTGTWVAGRHSVFHMLVCQAQVAPRCFEIPSAFAVAGNEGMHTKHALQTTTLDYNFIIHI